MSFVPLTQAVTSGDASEVSALLANGADVNERTGGGQTPLILATIFGHTHLISLLLEAGADPHLRDNLGLNAVDWAQRRGATEAIDVLTNKPNHNSQTRIGPRAANRPAREAQSFAADEVEKPKTISAAEKSQRWLAGLKQRIAEQRIAEQSQREEPEKTNIFRAQPEPPVESARPVESVPPVKPVPPPRVEAVESVSSVQSVLPEPEPEPEPQITQIEVEPRAEAPRAEAPRPTKRPARKRCPKCNAIYNSDLLAYCAHHVVELVDADAPPIISAPGKNSPALFWMIIVITLTGSIAVGSFVAALFYNSNRPATQTASSQSQGAFQKGTPAIGPELDGKAVSLPIAECPLNGQEAIPGTVVVRVVIDKNGQVVSAHASGGDWLLRGAANEAAMKSTFSPEKLRGRDTEGTITYTFEP